MSTENRGVIMKALWPGVKGWFGVANSLHKEEHKMIFMEDKSDQAFEEDVELYAMGLASIKSEGASTAYDGLQQGFTQRYTHLTYSLGYIVTEEAFDDNKYKKVAKARTRALATSFHTTKEVVAANTLNRATNGSYLGGDGVPLLSTAHPTKAGTFANRMTTAADLSEAALEDVLKLIMKAEDNAGNPIALKAKRLIVGPDLSFDATRITQSTLQSGTANNDVNAMRSMGLFEEDPMVYHYLTDTDAWFVTTDAQDGLKMYQRKPRVIRRDNEFDTDNMKVKAVERYSFGWTDPRGIYGSPGAS